MTSHLTLRSQIETGRIVVAPGIFNAFGALLAERSGFHAAYLSGASIAYCQLGRPDIGLVTMTEVAGLLSAIAERTSLPLVVDADTGFGNALNVIRTFRLFERAGAAAIQLEDQTVPKRCGHLAGKVLVSVGEMVGKIRAAVDARSKLETIVIARTDAISVEGLEPALERAERYLEAGADLLFIEAPDSLEQLQAVARILGGRARLMANMVEGGKTPLLSAAELDAMGYALVIFPGGLVRAFARAAQDYFACLKQHGSTRPFLNRMLDFNELNELLDTEVMLATGKKYEELDRETASSHG
jgi:2-methylisocitrate lyase-like PEP mutase family enzyme